MRLATFRGPDGNAARRCRRRRGRRRTDRRSRRGDRRQRAGRRPARAPAERVRRPSPRPAPQPTRAPAASRWATSSSCAPIRRPGKLLAVAGNFQAHIEEGGGQRVDKTKIVPKLFIKPSSAIIGPGEAVTLPQRLERPRLGARARHRHRHARPRHPARQGPRLHRRVLGHQRHLRPLDAVGRRGARAVRLRRLLRLAQRQVGRRLRGAGARGSRRPTR